MIDDFYLARGTVNCTPEFVLGYHAFSPNTLSVHLDGTSQFMLIEFQFNGQKWTFTPGELKAFISLHGKTYQREI